MVDLPDRMPVGIAKLPLNKVGYPVPWFVARKNETGTEDYDFRVIGNVGKQTKSEYAAAHGLCWVCGDPLTRGVSAFLIGPMCAVNRTSAEPPSHLACARWSAIACPFLARPNMVRRDRYDFEKVTAPGIMIERNPGVTLVWMIRPGDATMFDDGQGGKLFDVGEPRGTEWYARGRQATREEIMASIDSGIPILRAQASQDGPDALKELDRLYEQAMQYVPS